jgi:chromosome segregation ATPase
MTLHEQIEAALDNHCIKYPFTARMEVDRKDLRALLNENKALRDKLAEIDRLETDLEIMSDNYKGALVDLEESKASEKALREQLQEAEAMEEHERKQAEGMAEKVAALREREKALVEALKDIRNCLTIEEGFREDSWVVKQLDDLLPWKTLTPPTAGAGKEE